MKKNNKKGFTLVELVIVVAVMAVLVAVAIPTVSSIVGEANDAVDQSNARAIESVLKLAEAKAANESDDGTATLDAGDVQTAVAAAKLGITDAVFKYDPTTGVVSVGSAGSGSITITFAADGTLSVS